MLSQVFAISSIAVLTCFLPLPVRAAPAATYQVDNVQANILKGTASETIHHVVGAPFLEEKPLEGVNGHGPCQGPWAFCQLGYQKVT